jgi:FixJ family two-component response regulator
MLASMSESDPIVHVIDDDEPVRDAIENLLSSVGRTARTYSSAMDFLETADRDQPGCILADIRLPRLSGLELQRRLNASGFDMPIVLMTGFADIPMTVRGMKNGAIDFLQKPLNEQDIIEATDNALEKDRMRRERTAEDRLLRSRYDSLTLREHEVVVLVVAGHRNRAVAKILELSEITVKIHRSSAMRKLGAKNVQDLVRLQQIARRIGIEPISGVAS